MKHTYIEQADKGIYIEWDDPDINWLIGYLFKPWQKHSSYKTSTIHIAKIANGHRVVSDNNEHITTSLSDLAIVLELLITETLRSFLNEYLQIHACTVSYKGKAVALVGNHGLGKTTLACAAIKCGLKVLTDDITIISRDYTSVIGFPRPLKVTGATWDMTPSLVPGDSPFIKTNSDTFLFFHQPPGKYFTVSSIMKNVIFLTRRVGTPLLVRIGEMEAYRRICPQGFNFYLRKNTLFEELHILFLNAPPAKFQYYNPVDAIKELKPLMV